MNTGAKLVLFFVLGAITATSLMAMSITPLSYAADSITQSGDIERVEVDDSSRTTYFKNGTKHIEIIATQTLTFTTTVNSWKPVTQVKPWSFYDTLKILNLSFDTIIKAATLISIVVTLIVCAKIFFRRKKRPSFYTQLD